MRLVFFFLKEAFSTAGVVLEAFGKCPASDEDIVGEANAHEEDFALTVDFWDMVREK